jgi:hypothetical protein
MNILNGTLVIKNGAIATFLVEGSGGEEIGGCCG